MVFRVLRLFLLRFLPRRMFAFLTLIELVMLARSVYLAATRSARPAPRLVGRSGFDDETGPDAAHPRPGNRRT